MAQVLEVKQEKKPFVASEYLINCEMPQCVSAFAYRTNEGEIKVCAMGALAMGLGWKPFEHVRDGHYMDCPPNWLIQDAVALIGGDHMFHQVVERNNKDMWTLREIGLWLKEKGY